MLLSLTCYILSSYANALNVHQALATQEEKNQDLIARGRAEVNLRRAKQSSRNKGRRGSGTGKNEAADAEQEIEDDDEDAAIMAATDGDEPPQQPTEGTTRNRRKHRSVFNQQRGGGSEELGQQLQRERLAAVVCGVATRNSALRERYPEVSVPVRIQGVLRNVPKVTQQSRVMSTNFGRGGASHAKLQQQQKQQQKPVLKPSLPLVDRSRAVDSTPSGMDFAAASIVGEREDDRERTVQQALTEAKQRLLRHKLEARRVQQSIANRTVANMSSNSRGDDQQQDEADDEEKGDAAATRHAPYVFGLGKYTPRLPLRSQALG